MLPTATLADTSLETKCYPNEEFMKIIGKLPTITMFSEKTKDNKMKEIMIDIEKRESYTIEYDGTPEGSAMKSKEYCVTSVDTDVYMNTNAIEFFNKIVEKLKGQKT